MRPLPANSYPCPKRWGISASSWLRDFRDRSISKMDKEGSKMLS